MQRKFQVAFHVPGELGANLAIKFTVPSDCTLKHVSAVQSDADAAGIIIGTSGDPNGYIETYSCGVSGTPVEKEAITDFDGDLAGNQYPHIVNGTIVTVDVDFDYNAGQGGGAASDVTIVLTFLEG